MITIHSMPTRFRPLPELEVHLKTPQLRELAYTLDRVKIGGRWCDGLCTAIATKTSPSVHREFGRAVSNGMNKNIDINADRFCVYLYHYLYLHLYLYEDDDITLEELTAIRRAWAAHIARSIYEQIGD